MTEVLTTTEPEPKAGQVSPDQLALIKRTVAFGATDDELRLFIYDCSRRGVHPLDKLIHFTKRAGRYTPVTSIDFMLSRAHETELCAGISDAVFSGVPKQEGFAARVTVERYHPTRATRAAYAATARWEEYYPGDGPQGAMWRKMPHTMLGKCALALALRKGFPQQLSGLYASEELDQAVDHSLTGAMARAEEARVNRETGEVVEAAGVVDPNTPVYVLTVDSQATRNKNVMKYVIVLSDGRRVSTIKDRLGAKADGYREHRTPVAVEVEEDRWGLQLKSIKPDVPEEKNDLLSGPDEPPPDDDELVF